MSFFINYALQYTKHYQFGMIIMSINVGIIMDPIESISFKKDTSLALLDAAKRKGWNLFYMEQKDLALEQGEAFANMCARRFYG